MFVKNPISFLKKPTFFRKDYGSFGKEIELYTNFYEVKYDAKMKIYIYEVEIDVS